MAENLQPPPPSEPRPRAELAALLPDQNHDRVGIDFQATNPGPASRGGDFLLFASGESAGVDDRQSALRRSGNPLQTQFNHDGRRSGSGSLEMIGGRRDSQCWIRPERVREKRVFAFRG